MLPLTQGHWSFTVIWATQQVCTLVQEQCGSFGVFLTEGGTGSQTRSPLSLVGECA